MATMVSVSGTVGVCVLYDTVALVFVKNCCLLYAYIHVLKMEMSVYFCTSV